MQTGGFDEDKSTYRFEDHQGLIGQFRNLGSAGPAYEIMGFEADGRVIIEVVYSGERVVEALEDVLGDPTAETIP